MHPLIIDVFDLLCAPYLIYGYLVILATLIINYILYYKWFTLNPTTNGDSFVNRLNISDLLFFSDIPKQSANISWTVIYIMLFMWPIYLGIHIVGWLKFYRRYFTKPRSKSESFLAKLALAYHKRTHPEHYI
jgi:Gpi18-like mannosyltransferase